MGITSFARRLGWNLRALGTNPLIRASDRLEALAVLAVLAVAAFAVPVAAQADSEVYAAGSRLSHAQTLSRHRVQAVAVVGSTSMPANFDGPAYVRAQWHQGAQLRTESVVTPLTIAAGESLTIWLDDTDKVVAAPLTMEDARLSALGAAATVWIALVVCSALVAFLIRGALDRSRDRAWDRELRLLAHNDDGWANRHT